MQDSFGRAIDYIRVSITDRCNLRCAYCKPGEFVSIPHDAVMRYEEILRVCAAAAKMGIQTVKVTGGEPLVRMGCVDFIKALKAIPGIAHVTLTTNGVLLEPHVQALAELGLDGVNISLDSLEPDTYRRIAGVDAFDASWRALLKAVEAGLRVKVNCVPIKGVNDHEIPVFGRLAETVPVDVRFIELMPTREGEPLKGVSGAEVIALLSREYPDLSPDPAVHGFGPARYYRSDRLRGGIGIIDAVSNHFCGGCNRLRLTSEGFLKLCLYHDAGLDLRGMLRSGASDAQIEAAMAVAVSQKPERHSFDGKANAGEGIKWMSRIGG